MSGTVDCSATLPNYAGHCVEEERSRSRPLSAVQCFLWDTRNVPRYLLKYGIFVLAALGLLQLWVVRGDGPMPGFRAVPTSSKLDPQRVSSAHCVLKSASDRDRWAGLAPAVAILHEVNPEVGQWVEHVHRDGRLTFTDRSASSRDRANSLAKFDHFERELRINPGLYAETDGSIAAILCHEYRHARQSFPKVFSHALSYLLLEGGDPSIIENDAVLFEQEARCAIFSTSDEALEAHIARLAAR